MGRIIEGVWDCAYCGSTKIRGKLRVCPVCSRQRDDNIKFYLDDPTNYVSDEEAKNISRNPDWLCSHCDALNSDNEQKCHECGADRSGSEKNYFENRAEIDARRSNSLKHEIPSDLVNQQRLILLRSRRLSMLRLRVKEMLKLQLSYITEWRKSVSLKELRLTLVK